MKRAAVVALAAFVWPALAAAEPAAPCPDAAALRLDPRGAGPLPAGNGPADFGQVPEACPGLDVLGRLRGTLLVASGYPDYYGNLSVAAMVRLRFRLAPRTWMSVGLDVVTFRYVVNASLRAHGFDLGPPTVGLYHDVGRGRSGALALYGRLLLPVETARENGAALGGELGVAVWRPLPARLVVQGGVALPLPIYVIDGQAHAALRPSALAEAAWRAGGSVALSLGVTATAQAAPDAALTSIAARAGLRVAMARGFLGALVVEAPFAGDDRTDVIASLFVGWTPADRPTAVRP